ncbi:MAG TPA: PAS domain S-box protein [Noviherbaspirillum sp.]
MDQPTPNAQVHDRLSGKYADAAVSFATSLLENANDLVAAVDTEVRLLALNAAFRREFELVFGRPIELGQRLDDALAHVTGDREMAISLCRRALAGEHFRVIEELGDAQLLRKTYELAFSPVFDTRHQVMLAAIVMRDLTNLRQSERRFGALLEAAPDAMIIVRPDGIIDLANAHAERLFRYGRHQLTGLAVEQLLPERFRAGHIAHRKQFLLEAATRPMGRGHGGLWGLRSDGTEFPVDISLSPLDVGGEPMVVAAIRDMTIRQRAEEALKDSEIRFNAFMDASPAETWIVDEEGHLLYVNKAWAKSFGFQREEWIGKTAYDLTAPEVAAKLRENDMKVLEGGKAMEAVEVTAGGAAGETRYWHTIKFPFRSGAGQPLIGGMAMEITEQVRTQDALRKSEAALKATFEQAAVGIVHVSLPDCRLLRVNNALCTILGYTPEELLGMAAQQLVIEEDCHLAEDDYTQLISGQLSSLSLEKRAMCKNGTDVWLRITLAPVRDTRGDVLYAVAVVEDITQTKRLDLARQESENRLRLAVSIAHLGFWEWDVAADAVYYSPQWKSQIGYREDELQSGSEEWILRLHPDDRSRVLDYVTGFIKQPETDLRIEYRLRHRDDSYRWMEAKAIALRRADGRAEKMIGIQLDVTDTKLAEQRVLEAAQHDPLTGLPSRPLVFEYAKHLLAAARRNHTRGAVLFIDLDRFKPVNDLYGHETGDQLLKEVAKRLVGCVRDEDLVGRLGGDEFVIVLPHLGGNRAETVAAHVLNILSQPFQIASLDLSISASIGISYFPQHGTEVETLIHAADLAMYQTKQSGRANYHLYSDDMEARRDAAAAIEARLKRALKENRLVLHYQPVVHMRSGELLGVEALLRLDNEDGDIIGPERVIPVAESSGLIAELGAWVIAEACRQHEEWRRQGMPPMTIAINVSPLQFRQRSFPEVLRNNIHVSGIAPSCVQIEINESTVMDNIEDATATLADLKSIGVRIALDDFGTGYTSLSQLSHLPLDKLKVDQSFVRRIEYDRTSRAITGAIISLGKTLDLEVVCEGVESESALHYLQAQGCDQAQGFFISRPLPAAELGAWLRAQRG